MKISAKQFAEIHGVQYTVAYGFLRFLMEKNLVSTEKVKEKGVRGPGTIMFDLPEDLNVKTTSTEEVQARTVSSEVSDSFPI